MNKTLLLPALAVAGGPILFAGRQNQLLIGTNQYPGLDQKLIGVGNPTVVKAVFA